MNNAEQILFCRDLVNDYLSGRWQRIKYISSNPQDLFANVKGNICHDFSEILLSVSPIELYSEKRKLPVNSFQVLSDEIRLSYCTSYLLSALTDLACGLDSRFILKVQLFCINFSDLLKSNSCFYLVADLFLLPDSFMSLGQSIRLFYVAQSRRMNASFPKRMSIVLGMHRSGTSALTGLLGNLGISGPNDALGATENNLLGYWESKSLVTSSDCFLSEQNSHWSQLFYFSSCWWKSSEALTWISSYWDQMQNVFDVGDHFVLKDPRLCILLEGMIPLLQESLLQINFLLILRQPVEVVVSLCRAENISTFDALNLWIGSVLRSEFLSRYYQRKFFTYPQLLQAPQSVLDNFSDLSGNNFKESQLADAKSFIMPSLYRTKSDSVRDSFIESYPELSSLLSLADEIYSSFDQLVCDDHNFYHNLEILRRRWIKLLVEF